jgi:hypothetical protein
VHLTNNLPLAPRLRMRGAIPPLPHVFVAWCLVKPWKNLTLPWKKYKKIMCHGEVICVRHEPHKPLSGFRRDLLLEVNTVNVI